MLDMYMSYINYFPLYVSTCASIDECTHLARRYKSTKIYTLLFPGCPIFLTKREVPLHLAPAFTLSPSALGLLLDLVPEILHSLFAIVWLIVLVYLFGSLASQTYYIIYLHHIWIISSCINRLIRKLARCPLEVIATFNLIKITAAGIMDVRLACPCKNKKTHKRKSQKGKTKPLSREIHWNHYRNTGHAYI